MQIIIGIIVFILFLSLAIKLVTFLFKVLAKALPYILGIGIIGGTVYGLYVLFHSKHIGISHFINLAVEIIYFVIAFAALFAVCMFISEVLKLIKLRWLMIPALILITGNMLSVNNMDLQNSSGLAFAFVISIIIYLWSVFETFRLKRCMGLHESIENSLMTAISCIASSFIVIILYSLGFPNSKFNTHFNMNIYIYVLNYIYLLSSVILLKSEFKIYKQVKKYINKHICFSYEDILQIPCMVEKKDEKVIYAGQILFRMLNHKSLVEMGVKNSLYIRAKEYKYILAELSNGKDTNEILKNLMEKYKLKNSETLKQGITLISNEMPRTEEASRCKTSSTAPQENIGLVPNNKKEHNVIKTTRFNNETAKEKLNSIESGNAEVAAHLDEADYSICITPEKNNNKPLKKDNSQKLESDLKLLRYKLSDHSVAEALPKYKEIYFKLFSYMLDDLKAHTGAMEIILDEYAKAFGITNNIKLSEEKDIDLEFSKIRKKEFYKTGFLKYRIRDYRYLLLLEAVYFRYIIENTVSEEFMDRFSYKLKINEKTKELLKKYIYLVVKDKNFKEAETLLQNCNKKYLTNVAWPLHNNIIWSELYSSLPRYNVAVCATMSAGKSTLINALLGKDFIPSRNEACTAKITTIYDNDRMNSLIGMKIDQGQRKTYSMNISHSMLEEWNNDNEVKSIILESDLDGVKCDKGVVAVHDTPGTNYSQDKSHHDITINFLKTNPINMIIYIINAEHSSTIDNQILLKQIKTEVIEKGSTKIVFLVNKIDSFDNEKDDDIVSCLKGIKNELMECGYSEPVIVPISANAARLFKMVLNGQALSKKEAVNFKNLFELFYDEGLDLTKYANINSKTIMKSQENSEENITVGGSEYKRSSIIKALQRTGLGMIEAILDNEINA